MEAERENEQQQTRKRREKKGGGNGDGVGWGGGISKRLGRWGVEKRAFSAERQEGNLNGNSASLCVSEQSIFHMMHEWGGSPMLCHYNWSETLLQAAALKLNS